MSHEVDTMAWAIEGGQPWHGLGAKVQKGADIDEWRIAAGLTWSVETGPVAVKLMDLWHEAEGHRAVYRNDTGKLFCIASERYKPVQPGEILEFFRGLADSHGLEIETCGSLKEGSIVWALATNGNSIRVHGVDEVKPYLLLSTAMDLTQATQGKFVATRVVCNNTIQAAWGEDAPVVKVRHSTEFDAEAMKARLGLIDETMANFAEAADKLSNSQVTLEQSEILLRQWFGKAKDPELDVDNLKTELTTRSANVIEAVRTAMIAGPGQDLVSAKGTAWGVLNGVTRYVDFSAGARSNDNRLASAWFGHGNNIKQRAMQDLLKLVA